MPPRIKVSEAKKNLKRKGFKPAKGRDHAFLFFYDENDKKTDAYAYFSDGGKKGDGIGPHLYKKLATELHLEKISEVYDLLECKTTQAEYIICLAKASNQGSSSAAPKIKP